MLDQRDTRSVLESAEKAAASGDFASAEQLLREAARLQEASLGPLHPDLANTLNNLGVVCEVAEKPAEAERYFRRAYDIAMASLDPDHPFVATSRKNLEDFCAAKGLDVVVPVPLPAPVPPSVPSPPPALAPSPAKTIEKKPRLEPRATVRPEEAIDEKAHSTPAKTSVTRARDRRAAQRGPARDLAGRSVVSIERSAGVFSSAGRAAASRAAAGGEPGQDRVAEASRHTGRKARRNHAGRTEVQ